ncbi:MAG: Crp/Fnr family transcriptional regulator [Thiotrichales bacterium]
MSRYEAQQFASQLRNTELFGALPRADFESLTGLCEQKVIDDQRALFLQDAQCHEIHLLISGLVKLCRNAGDHRRRVLGLVYPDDLFCLEAMYSGERYPFTAQTIETCWLAVFPARPFARFVQQRPELQQRVLRTLSVNSKRWMLRLEHNQHFTAEQRIAAYLIDRLECSQTDGLLRGIPKRRTDLASLLAMTPETLCREVRKLKTRGLLEECDGELAVSDCTRLRELCEPSL